MSIKSHTENQTNSNETKNDHAPDVVHHEESDTWECPDCGTLKPTREGAEQHCSDGGDDEGLSTSSSHELPEALQERDIWICWRYEKRDGEMRKVPVKPYDDRNGTRQNVNPEADGHGEPENGYHYAGSTWIHTWRSCETARDYHENGGVETEGTGYMFSEEGLLVGVDLDDVRDPETGDVEPWAKEVIDELDSYTELSPSGTGFHIVVFGVVG